jgi:hypothetical protein
MAGTDLPMPLGNPPDPESAIRAQRRSRFIEQLRRADERQAAAAAQRARASTLQNTKRAREANEEHTADLRNKWGVAQVKPDAAELLAELDRRGVRDLVHVTEMGSLGSILDRGILSPVERRRGGLRVARHAYGSPGKQSLLDAYVALAFRPQWGMAARLTAPVILACDRDIALHVGAFVSSGNTARGDIDVVDEMQRQSAEDFAAVFEGDTSRLREWQAEVWVPVRVAPEDILGITFRSEADAQWAIGRLCARMGSLDLRTVVDFQAFAPKWQATAAPGTPTSLDRPPSDP